MGFYEMGVDEMDLYEMGAHRSNLCPPTKNTIGNMPADEQVQREVWNGRIPVEFILADDQIPVMESPKPYYVLLPRINYLPVILEKVVKYFTSSLPDSQAIGDPWLESDGIPLKWHYPIGVLFDLSGVGDSLPWSITLHFKDFPATDILALHSKESIESIFIQSVKEADQMKHRGEIMNNKMQKKDHRQLWMGLVNDKFDQFWSVNKRLMENSTEEPFRGVPVKIYENDEPVVQRLCVPLNSSGERTTIEDHVHANLPHSTHTKFMCHGIQIPPQTPVLWLAENLCYPDNFVHLVLP